MKTPTANYWYEMDPEERAQLALDMQLLKMRLQAYRKKDILRKVKGTDCHYDIYIMRILDLLFCSPRRFSQSSMAQVVWYSS